MTFCLLNNNVVYYSIFLQKENSDHGQNLSIKDDGLFQVRICQVRISVPLRIKKLALQGQSRLQGLEIREKETLLRKTFNFGFYPSLIINPTKLKRNLQQTNFFVYVQFTFNVSFKYHHNSSDDNFEQSNFLK